MHWLLHVGKFRLGVLPEGAGSEGKFCGKENVS